MLGVKLVGAIRWVESSANSKRKLKIKIIPAESDVHKPLE